MRIVDDTDDKPSKHKILDIRMQTLKKTKTGWKVENEIYERRPAWYEYYGEDNGK